MAWNCQRHPTARMRLVITRPTSIGPIMVPIHQNDVARPRSLRANQLATSASVSG